LISIIDQLACAGTERIGFSGGEPMLRNDIGQLVSHAKRRGLTVNLLSNGWQVPDRIDELEQLDYLAISLDGPQEIHDALRGKGAFEHALNAIRAAKRRGLDVWTTTVLTRHNLHSIHYVLALARREGVRATFLPVMRESLYARNYELLVPDLTAMVKAMDILLAEKRRTDSPLAASPALLKYYRSNWGRPRQKRPGTWQGKGLRCCAGNLFCAIGPDGKLSSCIYRQADPGGLNIVWQGFQQAWLKLKSPQCQGCWCDSFIEANQIFSGKPSAILHGLGLLMSDGND
jgi:MoaA/NifB/PqqE/SkfB family radical SAM enzyme